MLRMLSRLGGFSLYFTAVVLGTEIVHYVLLRLIRRDNKSVKSDVTKLVIFPDAGYACRNGENGSACTNPSCKFLHEETSLQTLLTYLRAAKRRLDVCVYLISSNILADTVVNCHASGTKVRVITDYSNTGEDNGQGNSQIGKFRKNGIPVRYNKSSFLMHHKFVIVDEQILITGSFNWTNQAITGNNEHVIITNNPNFVNPLIKEFNALWSKYDPKLTLWK